MRAPQRPQKERPEERPATRLETRPFGIIEPTPMQCRGATLLISRQKPHRQISVGGAAIDGLKERRSLENVNRLRDLRLDKLPFARRHGGLVFGGLVIYSGLALLILILIYQKIPPRISQTISQVRFAEPITEVPRHLHRP
jgi:hypothetical protein